MLKEIFTVSLVTTLFACGNKDNTQTSAQSKIVTQRRVDTTKADKLLLTFDKFKNSKWIAGEVGVNGEQPDTIIFSKPDYLTYISSDTGKELCRYSFDKDTLVFYDQSFESDMNSLDDLTCENENKLHFENGTFKYMYFDKKCTGDKVAKRIGMETLDVRFKRL